MSRSGLGELEHLTMLAVVRLEDRAYGGSVREELLVRAQRDVSIATVYVTLVRLERKGLLRSRLGPPSPVRGGKAKRLFHITKAGKRSLLSSRRAFEAMWESVWEPTGP